MTVALNLGIGSLRTGVISNRLCTFCLCLAASPTLHRLSLAWVVLLPLLILHVTDITIFQVDLFAKILIQFWILQICSELICLVVHGVEHGAHQSTVACPRQCGPIRTLWDSQI